MSDHDDLTADTLVRTVPVFCVLAHSAKVTQDHRVDHFEVRGLSTESDCIVCMRLPVSISTSDGPHIVAYMQSDMLHHTRLS